MLFSLTHGSQGINGRTCRVQYHCPDLPMPVVPVRRNGSALPSTAIQVEPGGGAELKSAFFCLEVPRCMSSFKLFASFTSLPSLSIAINSTMNGSVKSLRTSEKTLETPASSQTLTYCATLDVVERTALPKYEGEADQKNYLNGWNLHTLSAASAPPLRLYCAILQLITITVSA